MSSEDKTYFLRFVFQDSSAFSRKPRTSHPAPYAARRTPQNERAIVIRNALARIRQLTLRYPHCCLTHTFLPVFI